MPFVSTLTLEHFDPPWFYLAVILGSLAVLAGTYHQIYRRSGRRLTWTLLAMRTLGVLALLAALVKPAWEARFESVESPIAAVIVDDSQSMSLPHASRGSDDAGAPLSRYRAARRWLERSAAGRALDRDFDLRLFDIAGRPLGEAADALPGQPQAESTDLHRALHSVSGQLRGRHVAGLLLISDGRDTTGRGHALELAESPHPVFTVGFAPPPSPEGAPVDVSITEVRAPDRTRVHHTVNVQVRIRKRSGPAVDLPLYIERAGTPLASGHLSLPEGAAEREASLPLTPEQPGTFVLAVRAAPPSGAPRPAEHLFKLRVEAQPLRVLYVEGWLRPEARFLRERLADDPDVDLATLARTAHPNRIAPGAMADTELLSAQRLEQIDVVLLGDFESTLLGERTYERLAAWVDAGGGMMVLGGYDNLGDRGLARTPLADLLPTEPLGAGVPQVDRPFRFTLTPAGRRHPALSITGQPQRDAALWEALPPLAGLAATGPLRPAATVLAHHPEAERPGGDPYPVLAVQPYGQGRIALLTADTTWRWSRIRRLAGRPDTLYVRFWSQMVRWLAGRGEEDEPTPLTVETGAASYDRGQRVAITARRNPAAVLPGGADAPAAIELSVVTPDGRRHGLAAAPSTSDPHRWTASYFPERGGRFRVDARLTGTGEGGGGEDGGGGGRGGGGAVRDLASASAEFMVTGSALELAEASPDPVVLRRIARMTGGLYSEIGDPDAAASLVEALPETPRRQWRTRTQRAWNSPVLFFLFLGCIIAEWFIRRTHQLI